MYLEESDKIKFNLFLPSISAFFLSATIFFLIVFTATKAFLSIHVLCQWTNGRRLLAPVHRSRKVLFNRNIPSCDVGSSESLPPKLPRTLNETHASLLNTHV